MSSNLKTGTSLLLIGNCVLDQVWELEYFPQQDEELRALAQTRVLGGNACNSAQILARLGNQVELVSSLADDSSANWLLQQLANLGISTRFCLQKTGYSTPESSIWLNQENGTRTIVHFRDLPELTLRELEIIPLHNYQWIHFEGRNIEILQKYIAEHEFSTGPVSLEIEKNRPGMERLLPFVDTAIVSSAYLKSNNISADQCFEYFTEYNANLNIVCTLGDLGIVAKERSGMVFQLSAERVERVVDTVGAGDCFIAGLIHQLSRQQSFESALNFANKLAAHKIRFKGMRLHE